LLEARRRAGAQVASAIDQGADLVIVNRFGRQEREGKGLSYLVERALSADIPVVIAVPSHRFADWIRFADGMSVKLRCERESLEAWWSAASARSDLIRPDHQRSAKFSSSSNVSARRRKIDQVTSVQRSEELHKVRDRSVAAMTISG
jgi:hypothetical protein